MITKSDFRRGDVRRLVQYIKSDEDRQVAVKDHTGREVDQEQLEAFVERSERYEMQRHIIVAPDPEAGFEPAEVDQNTRALMNEWRRDREGTQYVYAVHGHDDKPHAHVAITGREEDLYMDNEDVKQFRQTARKAFQERERVAHRQQSPEARAAAETERTAVQKRGNDQRPPGFRTDDDTARRSSRRDRRSSSTDGSSAQNIADNGDGQDGGNDRPASDDDPGSAPGPQGLTPAELLKIASRGATNPGSSDPVAEPEQDRDATATDTADEEGERETEQDSDRESTANAEADADYSGY